MNDTRKTIYYVAAALVLVVLAWLSIPSQFTPSAFNDQGSKFFPAFTDPNTATSLEIIDWDEASGKSKPFKVQFKNGRWTIPSHHDYPADGKDRLAKTAASVIDLIKDDFRTDNVAEFAACGVNDPLDEKASGAAGRGQRITIRDGNDQVLADFIIGKFVSGNAEFRFLRVPGQNRVYASKAKLDISANFEDWIDRDLLQVAKDQIGKIIRRDYSIDERTGSVNQRDNITLTQKDNKWTMNGGAVDSSAMQSLLSAIDSVTIEGVRRKPDGLSATLRAERGGSITQTDLMSLQSKGFYLSRDGQLLSNEGELQVQGKDGITYVLRFGEILHGSGLMISSGEGEDDAAASGAAASRYLFLTCDFDPKYFSEPPRPSDTTSFMGKDDSTLTPAQKEQARLKVEHDRWRGNVQRSNERAQELNRRYADWYYVIGADAFDRLHVSRAQLSGKKK